jgi:hypothetical protein
MQVKACGYNVSGNASHPCSMGQDKSNHYFLKIQGIAE